MIWKDPQILTAALLVAAAIQWGPAGSDLLRRSSILKRFVSTPSRNRRG